MKLSDDLEAAIAKLVWVETVSAPYEHATTQSTHGQWRLAEYREAHAECEALREQIREIVRAAVEREREACKAIADAELLRCGSTAGLWVATRIANAISARGEGGK